MNPSFTAFLASLSFFVSFAQADEIGKYTPRKVTQLFFEILDGESDEAFSDLLTGEAYCQLTSESGARALVAALQAVRLPVSKNIITSKPTLQRSGAPIQHRLVSLVGETQEIYSIHVTTKQTLKPLFTFKILCKQGYSNGKKVGFCQIAEISGKTLSLPSSLSENCGSLKLQ